MIYFWKIPDDYPEALIGEYDRREGPDRFLFKEGRRLGTESGTPIIRFKGTSRELEQFDDLANSAMIPLVSDRVAELLLQLCAKDVELVDSTVVANGKPIPGYHIVNVLNRVEGIDHQASVYTLVPGTEAIMKFERLRYREGCLGNLDLARDAEYSSHLLVSERLRNAMVSEGLRGIGLYRPTECDR
jgi:hypothetical protein